MNPADLNKTITETFERLTQLTDAASRSDAIKTYLTTCAKFHNYSLGNQLLIAWQNPDATRVAGFGTWLKLNRYVRRGEHGIAILAPCVTRSKDEETGETKASRPVFFKTAYVFDVSQTDGEPLPEIAWTSHDRQLDLENRLTAYAASLGISVDRSDASLHGTQGVSRGGAIELAADAGTKTLVHEIAHEILHDRQSRAGMDRETAELEAEATAYIVADRYGLDNDSPNYLALWDADSKKLAARFDRIRQAAAQIITAIEPKESHNETDN